MENRYGFIQKTVCMLAFLLFLGRNAAPACAETGETVSLPVTQVFYTDSGTAEKNFTYRMAPETAENPLPDGAEDEYIWQMEGNSAAVLQFSFRHAGIYRYTVMSAEPVRKPNYTYETRIFELTFYIGQDSSGVYEAPVILIQTEQGLKLDRLELDPSYRNPSSGGGGSGGSAVHPAGTETVSPGPGETAEAQTETEMTAESSASGYPDDHGVPAGTVFSGKNRGKLPGTGELPGLQWLPLFLIILFLIVRYIRRKFS